MADRKVSVGLELKAGQFKAEAAGVEEKVEGIDRKVDKLDRSITKIPPDAAKAAAAMKLLGAESGRASVRMDDLNNRTSLGTLDQRLIHTRGEVRALAQEFNRTGDANVLEKLFGAQRELKGLESLQKRLTGALRQGAEDGGREGGKSFMSALQGYLSTPAVGPIVGGAIATAVVAALPAVGGALMGAAGLGGIALGVVGQLQDPAVQKAFSAMGHSLSAQLKAATSDFKQPLIAAAGIFGDALGKSLHSIDFGSLSRLVVPVASGLGGFVTNLMPGINHMLEQAVPLLKAFSTDLEHVGTSLSLMFDLMARGGKGAQESLRGLVYVLVGAAAAIGAIVLAASKLTEWFIAAGSAVGGLVEKFGRMIPFGSFIESLGRGVKQFFDSFNGANDVEVVGRALTTVAANAALTADDFDKLTSAASKMKATFDTVVAAAVGHVFGVLVDAQRATLGWHESLLSLKDTLDQNGRAIDQHTGLISLNTKQGLANREAVLQVMVANMQMYQAMIAAGAGADAARAAFQNNTAALEDMLHKAHFTQKQIDDMIGSLKNVPQKTEAEIATRGLTDAINNLGRLIADLNHLDGASYGFTVTEKHVYESDYLTFRQDERRASGGPVAAGRTYLVGERGPELFTAPAAGSIIPNSRLMSGSVDSARWYGGRFAPGGMGGGGITVNASVTINAGMGTDGYAVGRQVAEVLRSYVNSRGGNVQVALGKG